MLLEYFAGLGSDFAESKDMLKNIAIVIPSYFGLKERIALVNAGKIAGVNILGFINTASAAALHYAKDKDFADKSEDIVFFNMGAAYTEAALVRFSSVKDPKTIGQTITKVEVVEQAFNAEVGSESFDLALTNHFADKYKADKSVDLRKSNKSMSKLKSACKKTKEVLSANTATPVNVESIYEDDDLREKITREEFEGLIDGEIQKAVQPLRDLLEKTGVEVDALAAVELIGGGSRVPAVQRQLSEVLGGRKLDRHLDGDEAAVMGAALFAANYSKSFVLKKMQLCEKFPYKLEAELVKEGEGAVKLPDLLEFNSLPGSLPIKVSNPNNEDFRLNVGYAGGEPLPPGTKDHYLASYEVSGKAEIDTAKYNVSEDTTAYLTLDVLGNLAMEAPIATGDYWESFNKTIRVVKEEADVEEEAEGEADKTDTDAGEGAEADTDVEPTGDAAAADAESGEGGSEPAGSSPEEEKEVEEEKEEEDKMPEMVEKVVTRRKRRKEVFTLKSKWLNPDDFVPGKKYIKHGAERLRNLTKADHNRRLTEEAQNKLESFILHTMSNCNDEDVEQVSTEGERDNIRSECEKAEDWLYEGGANAGLEEYVAKYDELEALWSPVALRLHEKQERPDALVRVRGKLSDYKKTLREWEEKKPWIPFEKLVNATAKCDEMVEWLDAKVKAQDKLKDHEDPVLTTKEMDAKLKLITKDVKKLQKIPKPKSAKDAEAKIEADASDKKADDKKGGEKDKDKDKGTSHEEL